MKFPIASYVDIAYNSCYQKAIAKENEMSKRSDIRRRGVWLTKNQIDKLIALAEKTGLKASEHIRRAIDSYLDNQETKESEE